MRIAARDKQIEIIRSRQTGRNEFNEPTVVSEVLSRVWAAKRTLGGREFLQGQQQVAEELATFIIRWRGDLRHTDRIVCDGRTYDIQALREIGRRQDLEIQAKAVA